jgi:hypothetical protein
MMSMETMAKEEPLPVAEKRSLTARQPGAKAVRASSL